MSSQTSSKTLCDDVEQNLSRRVAEAIAAQPFQCAMNAWRALIHFPELFQQSGQLIEGWYVIETGDRITMNQHMWCALANGRIVDPSVLLLVPPSTPVSYFAGLARSWSETEALAGEWFPQVCFDGKHGKDGLGHPGYKAARDAARQHVFARSYAHHPPKAMQFLTACDPDALMLPAPNPSDQAEAPLIEGGTLDIALSLTTAEKLPACVGQCWHNARNALLSMPHPFFGAFYVEGWVVEHWRDSIRITEHGWIWSPRLGIVDPTIVLKPRVPQRLAYFPGQKRNWSSMQTSQTDALPFARHTLSGGGLAYQEACHRAIVRGEALAWETGLPLLPQPGIVTTFRLTRGGGLSLDEHPWDFPVPSTPSPRVQALLRELEHSHHLP